MTYTAMADGFFPFLPEYARQSGRIALAGEDDVLRALRQPRLTADDFAALLSPAAVRSLEGMAQRAEQETLRHFGRAKQLFAPLYLGNHCTNMCVYCGFHAGQPIARKVLRPEEIAAEAKAMAATGLRKVLALTGDAPRHTGAAYIASAVAILAEHFPSVGIEVQALTSEEYAKVARAGADSMTMFQETYEPELYARLHLTGPKRDFAFRLDAPQRAAEAGLRGITLGALLGLGDWRFDIFMAGMHARWMQQRFPHLELAFSLPRIRPRSSEEATAGTHGPLSVAAFTPLPVSDRDFVQALIALRCFLPHMGITLSTRESAFLRDKLLPLGVTKLSAGVRTSVGGYASQESEAVQFVSEAGQFVSEAVQFIIDDQRSVPEMAAALADLGYQPVFADWVLPESGTLPLAGSLCSALCERGEKGENGAKGIKELGDVTVSC